MRNYGLYAKDIIDAMDAIEKFVEGMSFDDFGVNYELVWKTIKNRIPQVKPFIQEVKVKV